MHLFGLIRILWPNGWRYDLIRGHRMRVDSYKRILWSTSKTKLSVRVCVPSRLPRQDSSVLQNPVAAGKRVHLVIMLPRQDSEGLVDPVAAEKRPPTPDNQPRQDQTTPQNPVAAEIAERGVLSLDVSRLPNAKRSGWVFGPGAFFLRLERKPRAQRSARWK